MKRSIVNIFERLHFDILVLTMVLILHYTDPSTFIQRLGLAVLATLTLEEAYRKIRKLKNQKDGRRL